MNDARLAILVRMAGEVDDLETGAARSGSPALHVQTRPLWRLGPAAWSVMALAACAALAAGIVLLGGKGATSRATGPLGLGPEASSRGPVAAAPEDDQIVLDTPAIPARDGSMVLAIVEDPSGGVQCVDWSRPGALAAAHGTLQPADMARRYCRTDCVDGPHWLIAAKVYGPEALLPDTAEDVAALAACIMERHPERCDGGPMVIPANTVHCLPAGMRVVVERRSMAATP